MHEVHDYNTFDDPNQPVLKRAADSRWKYALYVVTLIAVLFAAAFVFTLIFHRGYGCPDPLTPLPTWAELTRKYQQDTVVVLEKMKNAFNGENMRQDLRNIARDVHVAGTKPNDLVGDYILARYKGLGYTVTEHKYQVLITYPNYTAPNTLFVESMEGENGTEQLSDGLGKVFGPDEAQQQLNVGARRTPVWWNGYARNGSASAPIVYVNYCTLEDFAYVKSIGIDVKDRIVLCRYGHLWRGAKVQEAAKRGALGAIIYSDPADYAPYAKLGTWPESYQMPDSGAQRGSTKMGDGDPLTPNMPSKPYVYRKDTVAGLQSSFVLPAVPVMPVSYGVAIKIFEKMGAASGAVAAPKQFTGTLPITYSVASPNVTFTMNVNSVFDERREIRNICARRQGTVEPDRYVLFSNHYDAWTNGAIDPASGTIMMMEAARVLTQISQQSAWTTRRSVMFCHWDGEEEGLLGSREWVEEFEPLLRTRAVAVINVDVGVTGNLTLGPSGTPSLLNVLVESTKTIPTPNADEHAAARYSVYDSWAFHFNQSRSMKGLSPPLLEYPGSGSDHYPFVGYAAVPVLEMSYKCKGDCNSLYHTMYEIPWTVENLYDPDFEYHKTVGKVALDVGMRLASSVCVPLNLNDFATFIQAEWKLLDKEIVQKKLSSTIGDYQAFADSMETMIDSLIVAASQLQAQAKAANQNPVSFTQTEIEAINHRLILFERSFLNPAGVYPSRSSDRHVLLTSALHDAYSGVAMASVRDPIEFYESATSDAEKENWISIIRQSLSFVQYSVDTAVKQLMM